MLSLPVKKNPNSQTGSVVETSENPAHEDPYAVRESPAENLVKDDRDLGS